MEGLFIGIFCFVMMSVFYSFVKKSKQLFYGKSLAGIFHSRNWQYDWCGICERVRMVGYACNNRSYVFVEHERNQGEKQLSTV